MLINLRNALMSGKRLPIVFLEWLQSDGTGYVDLQYAPTDPETRMLVTASTSTAASNYAPLVCSGMNTAMNDVSKPSFGFASINNDRQIYLKSARQHWWNFTANSGNWDDGNFHTIDIGQSGATSSTCSVDGQSISMQRISNSTSGSMPTDTQTVFASKYNGAYYMINSKFKVSRIAYEVNGVIVHDFRAAMLGQDFGFYDEITGDFMAGVGTFVAGPEIHAVEYIESHGTEYIDTGVPGRDGYDFEYRFRPIGPLPLGIGGEYENNQNCYIGLVRSNGMLAYNYSNPNVIVEVQSLTLGTDYDIKAHLYSGEQYFEVNGVRGGVGSRTGAFTSSYNLYLFAINSANQPTSLGVMRLYNFTAHLNTIPTRSLRPVRVGTEGAMMDVLTRRIYRNQGTGAFTYGNDLKYPIPSE